MSGANKHRAARLACDEFETALLAERVVTRTAGHSGWDPPAGPEDLLPYEQWEEIVKLFPSALQREFSRPEEAEDSGMGDVSAKLSAEVALSEDSGISLLVERFVSEDADEDGAYRHSSEKIDYTLWVGRKDWSGDSANELRAHLHPFQNMLKEHDLVGYQKFSGK